MYTSNSKNTNQHFGKVTFNLIEYTLTQQAYADNAATAGEVNYFASALDPEGRYVTVIWETTLAWDASIAMTVAEDEGLDTDIEGISKQFGVSTNFIKYDINDESNACDWESPVRVEW